MKLIDLKQNSEEWLEFRRQKIGASDAPIILGVSPFKTPYQLYLEKLGLSQTPQNSAMRRGQEMEQEAREAFEEMYEMLHMEVVEVVPLVAQSDSHPWMIASLDGIDLEKKVLVEIKCPGPRDHQVAMDGKIPDHYIPQLQHQMLVTGLEKMFYFSYRTDDGHPVLLECSRNEDFLKKLVQKESEFFACLQNETPPPLAENDYEERCDLEFLDVAMRFSRIKEEIEQKLKEEQALKDELIKLSQNKNCRGGRVKISQCMRKGAIDYSKIELLNGVDLEPYRKPSSKYSTVSLC